MIPTRAYFATPEQERCQAGLLLCTGKREVRIHCITEGSDIEVCQACARAWRLNASAESLYNRCPHCATWSPGTRSFEAPASLIPLEGPVADALAAAMHMEGILQDTRQKVLQRLAKDASWLAIVCREDYVLSRSVPIRKRTPEEAERYIRENGAKHGFPQEVIDEIVAATLPPTPTPDELKLKQEWHDKFMAGHPEPML